MKFLFGVTTEILLMDFGVFRYNYEGIPRVPNDSPTHSGTSASEEFEDTKGLIRIRISKMNKQHSGQKKKYKRTNNDKI